MMTTASAASPTGHSSSASVVPLHERCANDYVRGVIDRVRESRPAEPEFAQAVAEVLSSLDAVVERYPEFEKAKILDRIVEPERTIVFRIVWENDAGEVCINRGWRVQFSSVIGPYKGGLRFHPSVNQSILKFLGFEQIFKNALTGQPIGGGKGGSNFDPKNKSDREVARFCAAFQSELFRHIGPDTDVPAGDIGVGTREIGYLVGMHRKLTNRFDGTYTGKGVGWGGSLIRTEATGYGVVYFAANMLGARDQSLEGKTCLVSGAGNVAQYTIEKLLDFGAKAVSVSDSGGFIHDPQGIDREKLEFIKDLKNERRGRIAEYAERFPTAEYHESDRSEDHNPLWKIPADCAFPSATQNEINGTDARNLLDNGVILVCEGANMPADAEAQALFVDAGILYGPSKAANAGGVAVSALEMAQNSQRMGWSREEVDARLQTIMKNIHDNCLAAARDFNRGNYFDGANIAGFLKVGRAMIDQGLI